MQPWKDILNGKQAFFLHDRNSLRPHVLLPTGEHSSGFFNAPRVLGDPVLLHDVASSIVDLLHKHNGLNLWSVNRVVGATVGDAVLAHALALHIARKGGAPCYSSYLWKSLEEGDSIAFKPEERVLIVKDVITDDTFDVEKVVVKGGGVVLPFVAGIVNLSRSRTIGTKTIVTLIDEQIPSFSVETCLLCQEGSKAIPPTGPENWILLNAMYPRRPVVIT